jgi:predicted transcriptional regulator
LLAIYNKEVGQKRDAKKVDDTDVFQTNRPKKNEEVSAMRGSRQRAID